MEIDALVCVNCGRSYEKGLRYQCEVCGFPLRVRFDHTRVEGLMVDDERSGVWRYRRHLPEVPLENQVTLGEGDTPLIAAAGMGEKLGVSSLWIKNEGQNPTGSFKDRPTSLGVSLAKGMGIDTVVVSSTGNAGASLAAYGARAGLRALVFVAAETPAAKLTQIAMHGAEIVPVQGTLSDAFWLAVEASKRWSWMNLTSTFLNPFSIEADKSVAYELFEQMGGSPDWVIVPVSVGPLLVGIYDGFNELKGAGLVSHVPRLVAAQAAECAPIARAYDSGDDEVRSWTRPSHTVAGGIADPLAGYEKDGTYTLRILKDNGGCATASTDDEILQAARDLARLEGVFSEPSAAVSVASLAQLVERGVIHRHEKVVSIVTGHGLKQVPTYNEWVHLSSPIEPTVEALAAHLEGISA